MAKFRRLDQRIISYLIVFSIAFIFILFVGYLAAPDSNLHILLTDGISPLIEVLAVAILLDTARKAAHNSKKLGRVWKMISLAFLMYVFGDLSWFVLELFYENPQSPSIADVFYILFFPLFIIGVHLVPKRRLTQRDAVNRVIDMSIIILSAVLVCWNFLVGPLSASFANGPSIDVIILAIYPIGDVLLLWSILVILYSQFKEISHTSIILLIFSIIVMVGADCIFATSTMNGHYSSHHIVDAVYGLSFFIAGLAGVQQQKELDHKRMADDAPAGDEFIPLKRPIYSIIPYISLVAAYILLVQSTTITMYMRFQAIAVVVGVIIGLVSLRQALVLMDNRKLAEDLYKSLEISKKQAEALQQGNAKLHIQIAERIRAERELAQYAMSDRLTGLPNRELFIDRLNQALNIDPCEKVNRYPVLFLDLDTFKIINDSLGHAAGDKLLVLVAERLRENLRSIDMISRLGGDEFVVLLSNIENEKSLFIVVEKILSSLGEPFDLDGVEVTISCSIGVVRDITGYDCAENILRDADFAMYEAKLAGRSRYRIFDISMHEKRLTRIIRKF